MPSQVRSPGNVSVEKADAPVLPKSYMLAGKDIYKHSTKYSAHAAWQ